MKLVGVLCVAACATPISFSGNTRAGDALKSDTARHISMLARLETKCGGIESIDTQIIAVNPVGTGNTVGSIKYGSVHERWVATLCGKSIPFSVVFTPDGEGGTFFRTSREMEK